MQDRPIRSVLMAAALVAASLADIAPVRAAPPPALAPAPAPGPMPAPAGPGWGHPPMGHPWGIGWHTAPCCGVAPAFVPVFGVATVHPIVVARPVYAYRPPVVLTVPVPTVYAAPAPVPVPVAVPVPVPVPVYRAY